MYKNPLNIEVIAMDWLQMLNVVILFGSIAVALLNIAALLTKTSSFFKKRNDGYFTEKLTDLIEKTLPQYFDKKYEELKSQLLKELEEYCDKQIEDVKFSHDEMAKSSSILRKHIVDVLRQRIENIYYKYRTEKRIPHFALENLEELFYDYKEAGGNHHIDKLYKKKKKWEVTDDLPEYDKE